MNDKHRRAIGLAHIIRAISPLPTGWSILGSHRFNPQENGVMVNTPETQIRMTVPVSDPRRVRVSIYSRRSHNIRTYRAISLDVHPTKVSLAMLDTLTDMLRGDPDDNIMYQDGYIPEAYNTLEQVTAMVRGGDHV